MQAFIKSATVAYLVAEVKAYFPPFEPGPVLPGDGNSTVEFWRYSHVNATSPFVIDKMHDGYPDVSFGHHKNYNKHMFNATSIVCPKENQMQCGDGSTCDAQSGRKCSGGIYCNAGVNTVSQKNLDKGKPLQSQLPQFLNGLPSSNNNKDPVPHPSKKNSKRSRRGIIERAVVWLAMHVPYMGRHSNCPRNADIASKYFVEPCSEEDDVDAPGLCPKYGYIGTCCGAVSAWTGVSEVQGHADNREPIACTDMLPGDYMAHHVKNGVRHWTMFRNWVGNSTKAENRSIQGEMKFYQMGGNGGAANAHTYLSSPWCTKNWDYDKPGHSKCIKCFRHPDLEEEDKGCVEVLRDFDDEELVRADGKEGSDMPEYNLLEGEAGDESGIDNSRLDRIVSEEDDADDEEDAN